MRMREEKKNTHSDAHSTYSTDFTWYAYKMYKTHLSLVQLLSGDKCCVAGIG